MESMMVYGGNNILDMTLRKVYEQSPDRFKGSGRATGFSYSYDVQTPPTVVLEASPARNIKIYLGRVAVTVESLTAPIVSFSRNLAMTGHGRLGIADGILSLRRLSVHIENPAGIDAAIQAVINSEIVPALETALSGIRLPQLQSIFSSSLSVQLRNGTVIAGPALEIGAKISGVSGVAAADRPTAANLNSLNSGNSSNALITGTVSEAAINAAINKLIRKQDLKYRFTKRENGALGFAGGVKGNIRSTKPRISINNNTGSVSAVVSADLWVGIKTPVTNWAWMPIAVPDVHITIGDRLTTHGNKAMVILTGVSSIRLSLNWPSILAPVESLVENLLNAAVSHFKGIISNVVSGFELKLFKLPATIPDTAITASLDFDGASGFSYYKESVKASVRISG